MAITLNPNTKAIERIKEANDYLNSLSPDSPVITVKQRIIGVLLEWLESTLMAKAADEDAIDDQTLIEIINREVSIE